MSGDDPLSAAGDLSYTPASVDMPPVPSIQPGEDALSMAIAAVLPAMHAGLQTSVTATQAKEGMFAEKVGDAKVKYQNADDQGGRSVGQVGGVVGQLGQLAQQSGQSGGGGGGASGSFGQLMEQAMKAAPGALGAPSRGAPSDSTGRDAAAQSAGPTPAGQPVGAAPAATTPQREENAGRHEEPRRESRPHATPEVRGQEAPARQSPGEAAGPGDRRPAAGPAPVAPPHQPRPGGDDLARRM